MTIRVFIPKWHPSPINKLINCHWGAASRRKKFDREVVHWQFVGKPKATGKRRLTLHIILDKGQRACDPDAYHKSLLDALVHAGQLTDDNRQGVELMPVKFSRDPEEWGTLVTLQDMEVEA